MKFLGADTSGQTSPAYGKIMLAGSIGGLVQLIPAVPIDVIKVVLQSQIPHGQKTVSKYYKGPVEGAIDIIKAQGVRGMYRGLPTQLIRDIPASATYFMIFEYMTYTGSRHIPHISSTFQAFVAGGMAGVLSWALIIPFDVIKSRIQADSNRKLYSGFLDCAIKSYRENGIKIFFRGLSLTSLRAFPVNGVTLMVHTEIMEYFGQEKYKESSA
ncbi:hypothetical protein FSP39_011540 [Pinctada imbricata]|uniref:Uncharacterized protein n=1 Tax=Pinctada imbricata TaxID=66713 RepID=A0AA88YBB1_PINIB|nr:hypothetical protein FSP39_011540 [Pinctada imbricata]